MTPVDARKHEIVRPERSRCEDALFPFLSIERHSVQPGDDCPLAFFAVNPRPRYLYVGPDTVEVRVDLEIPISWSHLSIDKFQFYSAFCT
jgi:hypothetical protein